MTRIATHWLIIGVLAGILDALLTLIPQSISILFISIIGWLVYILSSSKQTKWKKEYLLFSSITMSLTTYIGLLLICNIISNWVCTRNLLIPSLFVSLIPFWGWFASILLIRYTKHNK